MTRVFDLDDLKFSPTASLFEGPPRAGSRRWTAGGDIVELDANKVLVVPPETPQSRARVTPEVATSAR